jgi:MraZ protein
MGEGGGQWVNPPLAMDSDSHTQFFFAGEFRHSIDEKNRITIPVRWRRPEGEELIILPEPRSQFLLIMSPAEFARTVALTEGQKEVSADERRIFLRHLHARASHGATDKQGRLVLPEAVCHELGLKGEVALVGGTGRFEIWNLERWKRAHEVGTPVYQNVANVIGL